MSDTATRRIRKVGVTIPTAFSPSYTPTRTPTKTTKTSAPSTPHIISLSLFMTLADWPSSDMTQSSESHITTNSGKDSGESKSGGDSLGISQDGRLQYSIRLLAHSLTHILTYSLTHSLTYSLTYSRTHSLTHLLTHSLIA